MNASQLTLIKDAKRLLEDCSCFRGPEGPQGATGATGATGAQGPPGTITDFTIPGASTNALMYYTGTGFGAMSSLFYYSSINVLEAHLDIIPSRDEAHNLGSSNFQWNNIYTSTITASVYSGIENYNYISTSGLTSTIVGLGTLNSANQTVRVQDKSESFNAITDRLIVELTTSGGIGSATDLFAALALY